MGSGAAYPAESSGKTAVSRTQPSTGKEVTVGYELRGSSQAAGIKGLAHSRCCCLSTLGVVFPLLGTLPGCPALSIMLSHSATPLTRHKS